MESRIIVNSSEVETSMLLEKYRIHHAENLCCVYCCIVFVRHCSHSVDVVYCCQSDTHLRILESHEEIYLMYGIN